MTFAHRLLLGSALAFAAAASAQAPGPGQIGERSVEPSGQRLPNPEAANVRVAGAVYEPRAEKPGPDFAASLKVPQGFKVDVFAQDLGNARMLAVAPDGTVYLSRRTEGDIVMLKDTNRDGKADTRAIVAKRRGLHGITIHNNVMYIVGTHDVWTAQVRPDGTLSELTRIIEDLPDAGQHLNRTLAVGPDNMLYISIGSTCDACRESSDENAAIVRASLDGKSRTIFASGLRNTIGFGWHPATSEMWGWDQGIDWLGDEHQREEVNKIERGKMYGWPLIYGDGGFNPQDDEHAGVKVPEFDTLAKRPVVTYTAHSAGMQMVFNTGRMFPGAYAGDAFIAQRGSWNRSSPAGYEITRIRFENGAAAAVEPFVTGFVRKTGDGHAQYGRLAGTAMAPDGALLFSDDKNGVIYRVSYSGSPGAPVAARARVAVERDEPRLAGPAIAIARPETATAAKLTVRSADIAANALIPARHSAYYEDTSPQLGWSGAPLNTQSYVVIVDDPDAPKPKPLTHWIAYDIPATLVALPGGLPGDMRVKTGFVHGRNSRGGTGWFGPRPKVGEPAHRYHFQVFALSAPLGLAPGAEREAVIAAMAGKVIAKGELVGRYAQARPAAKL
ncbi:YbhB/YbcL family Raf kinase inhibitor-like protein [Glacieibacterium frigidum]|uniref:YbhB/YbcL family Raf kinase inhibitor-like protein n=1 Tax=Glacieibacterium frigidum TaxID=2593303 RepID=UPI00163D8A8D|nr:YbhB/YbcL family Raf kinase inhibitor-like protein [Glacieibacterium frigidum]